MTEKRRYRITVDTEPIEYEPKAVMISSNPVRDAHATITSCEPLPDPPQMATLEILRDATLCCTGRENVAFRVRVVRDKKKRWVNALLPRCDQHAQPGDLYLRLPSSGEGES